MPGSDGQGPPSARASAYPELRRFLRHKGAVTGSVLLLVLVTMAVAAPWLAPYDPIAQDQRASLRAPGPAHLLGTDVFGRDILARVIWGGRQSLRVGLLAVAVGGVTGTLLGLLAGFYRGWTGTAVLRLTDLLLAPPRHPARPDHRGGHRAQPREPHRGGRRLLDAGLRAGRQRRGAGRDDAHVHRGKPRLGRRRPAGAGPPRGAQRAGADHRARARSASATPSSSRPP